MSTATRIGLAGAISLSFLLLVSTAVSAPNPYRGTETETSITLASDGRYRVKTGVEVELALPYELGFDGSIHNGFRLEPDSPDDLPPYLRPRYELRQTTINGGVVPVKKTMTGHLLTFDVEEKEYPEGIHTAKFDYTVAGAATPRTDGYAVYYRSVVRQGDETVTVTNPPNATISGVDCVLVPPATTPCGTATDDGWVIDEIPTGEGIIRIDLAARPAVVEGLTKSELDLS